MDTTFGRLKWDGREHYKTNTKDYEFELVPTDYKEARWYDSLEDFEDRYEEPLVDDIEYALERKFPVLRENRRSWSLYCAGHGGVRFSFDLDFLPLESRVARLKSKKANLRPLSSGQGTALDNVFKPIIYIVTFPNSMGFTIASIQVIGMNERRVKKTLQNIQNSISNTMRDMNDMGRFLSVQVHPTMKNTLFFSADFQEASEEELEMFDGANAHFFISQEIYKDLKEEFPNLIVI